MLKISFQEMFLANLRKSEGFQNVQPWPAHQKRLRNIWMGSVYFIKVFCYFCTALYNQCAKNIFSKFGLTCGIISSSVVPKNTPEGLNANNFSAKKNYMSKPGN